MRREAHMLSSPRDHDDTTGKMGTGKSIILPYEWARDSASILCLSFLYLVSPSFPTSPPLPPAFVVMAWQIKYHPCASLRKKITGISSGLVTSFLGQMT